MKTALKVISWTMAILMGIGGLSLMVDGELEFYSILAVLAVEAQSIIALLFISDVEEKMAKKRR